MPAIEQLLDAHIHHFCSRYSAHPQTEKNLGSSAGQDNYGSRIYAQTYGKHQKLWRIQRELASRQSTLYSILRYESLLPLLINANVPSGVYLTDLTFIEDGIPSIIKKSALINFAKRAKTAEVIRDIQQYQNVPYPLQAVPELQEYILSNMQAAGDVHEMYEKSLTVEPREREDEKIVRYVRLEEISTYGGFSII